MWGWWKAEWSGWNLNNCNICIVKYSCRFPASTVKPRWKIFQCWRKLMPCWAKWLKYWLYLNEAFLKILSCYPLCKACMASLQIVTQVTRLLTFFGFGICKVSSTGVLSCMKPTFTRTMSVGLKKRKIICCRYCRDSSRNPDDIHLVFFFLSFITIIYFELALYRCMLVFFFFYN